SATYMFENAYCVGEPICQSVAASGASSATSASAADETRRLAGTSTSTSRTTQTATSSAISGNATSRFRDSGFIVRYLIFEMATCSSSAFTEASVMSVTGFG